MVRAEKNLRLARDVLLDVAPERSKRGAQGFGTNDRGDDQHERQHDEDVHQREFVFHMRPSFCEPHWLADLCKCRYAAKSGAKDVTCVTPFVSC